MKKKFYVKKKKYLQYFFSVHTQFRQVCTALFIKKKMLRKLKLFIVVLFTYLNTGKTPHTYNQIVNKFTCFIHISTMS